MSHQPGLPFPQDAETSGEFRVFQGLLALFLLGRIDPFPDRIKDTDVGGDGFRRISKDVDDAGVGKLLAKTVNRSRELRGLGKQSFVFSVEVKVALEAGSVVTH